MGLRTIHGDPVVQSISAGAGADSTSIGYASRVNSSTTDNHGWPNRLTGSLTDVTFALWGRWPNPSTQYNAALCTRGGGITTIAIHSSDAGNPNRWSSTWNDTAGTYLYGAGPTMIGEQFLVMVVRAGSIEFWIDGTLRATNITTNAALNFSNLTGATAWQTYDSFSTRQLGGACSMYLIYGRALAGAEIGALFAEPFAYIRR